LARTVPGFQNIVVIFREHVRDQHASRDFIVNHQDGLPETAFHSFGVGFAVVLRLAEKARKAQTHFSAVDARAR
jgi:hypothetical protein